MSELDLLEQRVAALSGEPVLSVGGGSDDERLRRLRCRLMRLEETIPPHVAGGAAGEDCYTNRFDVNVIRSATPNTVEQLSVGATATFSLSAGEAAAIYWKPRQIDPHCNAAYNDWRFLWRQLKTITSTTNCIRTDDATPTYQEALSDWETSSYREHFQSHYETPSEDGSWDAETLTWNTRPTEGTWDSQDALCSDNNYHAPFYRVPGSFAFYGSTQRAYGSHATYGESSISVSAGTTFVVGDVYEPSPTYGNEIIRGFSLTLTAGGRRSIVDIETYIDQLNALFGETSHYTDIVPYGGNLNSAGGGTIEVTYNPWDSAWFHASKISD